MSEFNPAMLSEMPQGMNIGSPMVQDPSQILSNALMAKQLSEMNQSQQAPEVEIPYSPPIPKPAPQAAPMSSDALNTMLGIGQNATPSVSPLQNLLSLTQNSAPTVVAPQTPQSVLKSKLSKLKTRLPASNSPTPPAQTQPVAPTSPVATPIDPITASMLSSNNEVNQAQQVGNLDKLFANITRAGATAGAAMVPLAGLKPDDAIYQSMLQNSTMPLDTVVNQQSMRTQGLQQGMLANQAKQALQMNDPNSSISQYFQKYTAGLAKNAHNNIAIPEGATAAQLMQIIPSLSYDASRVQAAQLNNQARALGMQTRADSVNSRIITNATKTFNQAVTPQTNLLNASQRAQDLIEQIVSGKITDASNVKKALTDDLAKILSGNNTTALGDREHADVSSVESNINAMLSKLDGKPRSTIPKDFVPQMQAELNTLRTSLLRSVQGKANQLTAGVKSDPKSLQAMTNSYNGMVTHYGFHPQTLQPLARDMQGRVVMPEEYKDVNLFNSENYAQPQSNNQREPSSTGQQNEQLNSLKELQARAWALENINNPDSSKASDARAFLAKRNIPNPGK